jgi:hypothetical protein
MTLIIQKPTGAKLNLAKGFTPESYMYEFPSQYPVWSPANITTALWLDAADASTITQSGGTVSQWNDKSGNNLHISQATVANQPAYTANAISGKPVLTFDGSNDTLERATGLNGLSNVTIVSVFRIITATNDDIPIAIGSTIASSARGFYRASGGSVMSALGYANEFISTLQWDVGGSHHIFGLRNTQLATPNHLEVYRDGVGQTGTGAGGNLVITSAGFAVGSIRGAAPTHCTNMEAAEVVVLASAASTDTRQRIEGYLAHKWGLTANLPNDHPYKTVGPTP